MNEGTVENLNSKSPARPNYSGRPMTVRTTENMATLKVSVLRDPKKSVRRRSQELHLNRQSLLNIIRKDLNLFPQKIQIKQTLTSRHCEEGRHVSLVY